MSHSFVASVYKPAFFQCSFSPISCTVQQCIQISTRINSSMYIVHTSFVSLETTFYIACIQQGFVDPKCNNNVCQLHQLRQASTVLAMKMSHPPFCSNKFTASFGTTELRMHSPSQYLDPKLMWPGDNYSYFIRKLSLYRETAAKFFIWWRNGR